jgi:flagellar hook-basal body complex protein FliE
MANITQATNAYSSAIQQAKGLGGATDAADSGAFGEMVKQSLQSAVDMQHKSEKISGQALAGKADMTDVLQAVTQAELALNTVLAVRDKVVQAYKDVMSTQM